MFLKLYFHNFFVSCTYINFRIIDLFHSKPLSLSSCQVVELLQETTYNISLVILKYNTLKVYKYTQLYILVLMLYPQLICVSNNELALICNVTLTHISFTLAGGHQGMFDTLEDTEVHWGGM